MGTIGVFTLAPFNRWLAMSDSAVRPIHPSGMLSLLPGLKKHWRFLGAMAVGTAAITAVLVFLLPRKYTSQASFQAEASQASPLSGSLAGLASQFGALQLMQPTNPQFFADLITSDNVIKRVASARYVVGSDTVTLATIYGYDKLPTPLQEDKTSVRLRKAVRAATNPRTGVISLGIVASSPDLARALVETTLVALNNANIALRQSRANAEAAFTSNRAEEARAELNQAEDALTAFYNRNRQIDNSASLRTVESRLRRAVDVAQNVYTQLRLQQEQAGIQAVRNTPVITTIDQASLPIKPTSPKRKLSVVVGFLAGLSLAIGWLLVTGQLRASPVWQVTP